MDLLFTASIILSFAYLTTGLYVFLQSPKSRINQVSFLLFLAFFIWAFAYAHVYNAHEKNIAWWWYKVSSFGWCLFLGPTFHFLSIISGVRLKRWLYLYYYIPPLVFLYQALFGVLFTEDFLRGSLGWLEVRPKDRFWSILYITYFSLTSLALLFKVHRKYKTTQLRRERLQTRAVLISSVSTMIFGSAFNLFLPYMLKMPVPALAPLFLIIFVIGVFLATHRYKFLKINPSSTAENILDSINDSVVLVDDKFIIERANRSFLLLFDHNYGDLKGINIFVILPQIRDWLTANPRPDDSFRFVLEANLNTFHLAITAKEVRDEYNDFLGYLLIIQDIGHIYRLEKEIDARKKAEQELVQLKSEIEKKYFQLLDEIEDGYYETDLKGRFTFVNKAWASMLERDVKDILSASYKEFIDPGYQESTFLTFNKVFRTGRPISGYEHAIITASGAKKDLEVSISLVRDPEGKPQGFKGIARDITVKKVQERLLKEKELRYKTLFEAMKYPVFLLDRDRFVECNRATEVTFRARRDEIIGKGPADFSPPYQPDGQSSVEKAKVFIDMAMGGVSCHFEWQHKRGDGSLFDAEVSLDRVFIEEKPYIQAIVYDITERKLAEKRLKALSITDDLTGLYNRRGFLELGEGLLKTAKRGNRGLFLIFGDLDGLKEINDTLGHSMGDAALRDAANCLKRIFRESDLIARLGGDEFVVLAMEGEETLDETRIMERIQSSFAQINEEGNRPYKLSISVGIHRWSPGQDIALEEILKQADLLMYESKKKRAG